MPASARPTVARILVSRQHHAKAGLVRYTRDRTDTQARVERFRHAQSNMQSQTHRYIHI